MKRVDRQGFWSGLAATTAAGALAVTPWLTGLDTWMLGWRAALTGAPIQSDHRLVHLVYGDAQDGLTGEAAWADLLAALGEAGARGIGLDLAWGDVLTGGSDETEQRRGWPAWLEGQLPQVTLATVSLSQRGVAVHAGYVVGDVASVDAWPRRASSWPRPDAAAALEADVYERLTQPVGGGEAAVEPSFTAAALDKPPVALMLGTARAAAVMRAQLWPAMLAPWLARPLVVRDVQPLVVAAQGRVLPHMGLVLAADVLEIDPIRLAAVGRRVVVAQQMDAASPLPLRSFRTEAGQWDVEALRAVVEGKAVLVTAADRGGEAAAVFTAVVAGRLHRVGLWWWTPAAAVAGGLAATVLMALARGRRRIWGLALLVVIAWVGWGVGTLALGWYVPTAAVLTALVLGPGLWCVVRGVSGAVGWSRRQASRRRVGRDVSGRLEAVVLTAWPQGLDAVGQRLHEPSSEGGGLTITDLLDDLCGAMKPAVAAAEPVDAAWRDGSVRCVFDAGGDAGRAAGRAAGLAARMQELSRAFGRRLQRRFGDPSAADGPRMRVTWHVGLAGGAVHLGSAGDGSQASAVGGAIDAAWRLTALGRRLGLAILADEWTRGQTGSLYLARPIGLARLHEGREPAMVWELLGEAVRISAVQRQQAEIAAAMVRMFVRREFDAAMERVEALAALDGRDPLPMLYRGLILQRRGLTTEAFDPTLAI